MHLRLVAGLAAELRGQLGQPRLAAGVDQQLVDEAQCVVPGGSVDGHRRIQQLGRRRGVAGREDLLQQQPALVADQLAEPPCVVHGIGQPVGVIDADSVDQILLAPPAHLGVRGVEDGRVLLPQPCQAGDGEEPPVAQQRLAPVHQPVVLPVVDLPRRATVGAGGWPVRAGRDREPVLVEVELRLTAGSVGGGDDDEVRHIVRRSQHRDGDPTVGAVGGGRVEVEERVIR